MADAMCFMQMTTKTKWVQVVLCYKRWSAAVLPPGAGYDPGGLAGCCPCSYGRRALGLATSSQV